MALSSEELRAKGFNAADIAWAKKYGFLSKSSVQLLAPKKEGLDQKRLSFEEDLKKRGFNDADIAWAKRYHEQKEKLGNAEQPKKKITETTEKELKEGGFTNTDLAYMGGSGALRNVTETKKKETPNSGNIKKEARIKSPAPAITPDLSRKAEDPFSPANGAVLQFGKDLREAPETMHDNTYGHRVNDEKNDFHNRLRDIHKESKLARRLLTPTQKEEHRRGVRKRITDRDNSLKKIVRTAKESSPRKKIVRKARKKQAKKVPTGIKKSAAPHSAHFLFHFLNLKPHFTPLVILITIIALLSIVSLIQLGSLATAITGAVVGSAQSSEIHLSVLGGIFSIIALTFVALHILKA